MKTINKIIIKIFAICIILVILNYLWINSFYLVTKKHYKIWTKIPDIENGYVPQGFCYLEKHNLILQTSYSKKSPSKIYIIDFTNGNVIKDLTLKDVDNNDLYIHAGGVASDEDKIWICGDNSLYVFDFSDVLTTNDNHILSTKKIDFPIHTDFCYYYNNKNILWVGEFKKPFDKKITPYILGYSLENSENIEDTENPNYKIEIPSMVQGFCIDDNNNFIFSRSYSGFILSSLDIYENMQDLSSEPGTNYSYKNFKKISHTKILPMSEGIFFKDNKFYVLFESGAKRYLYAFPKIKNYLIFNI